MGKLDKIIQEKLKDRTLEPSASAWERLSNQLEKQEKQSAKRKWFLYVGYAASITLLVSLFFMINKDDAINKKNTKEILVETKIDASKIKEDVFKENSVNEVIVQQEREETLPKKNIVSKKVLHTTVKIKNTQVIAKNKIKKKGVDVKKPYKILSKIKNDVIARKDDKAISIEKKQKNNTVIAQNKTTKSLLQETKQSKSFKSSIKINPDDLLYEVTHTKKEVLVYYAKNNINRKEVLKKIKKQLKKSNLKIDPEIILTAVERDISDDFFKNKFLQKLKSRVSTLVVAITERNK